MSVEHILTLDIGGTAIKYGVCDLQGHLSCKGQVPTPCGPDAKIEDLLDAIELIYNTCKEQTTFEGMAISAPGCVTKDGTMRTAGYLFYNVGQPLAQLVQERVGMRPVIENDAKAAAEAELWIGSMQGVSSGAVLILGTGLGGGLILNGGVYQGPHGAAGELSAFEMSDIAHFGGDFTNAANQVSATGLLLKVCRALDLEVVFDDKNHRREYPIDGRKVFELLQEGNEKVQVALDDFGRDAAFLIFNLCVVLDLERIAIGGGISSQDSLIDSIRRGVDALWAESPLSKTQVGLINKPEITVCQFRNDANLIGAMHHYLAVNKLL